MLERDNSFYFIGTIGENNANEMTKFLKAIQEKKLSFNDFLAKLSPGKSLRIALDDILEEIGRAHV